MKIADVTTSSTNITAAMQLNDMTNSKRDIFYAYGVIDMPSFNVADEVCYRISHILHTSISVSIALILVWIRTFCFCQIE